MSTHPITQVVQEIELDEGLIARLDAQVRSESEPEIREDQAARLRSLFDARSARIGQARAEMRSGETLEPRPRYAPPEHTRTQTIAAARKASVIAIASGKGGVGKSNIAVNIAIVLARAGLRVTLLDADLGTANCDVLCGIRPSARLEHVLVPGGLRYDDAGMRSIKDIAVDAPGGFKLVPGSAGISRIADLAPLERRQLVTALVELAADADVLLIDAAAGVGSSVTSLMAFADLGIVVTTPEPTAISDAYALIKCLTMSRSAGCSSTSEDEADLALVVNQASSPLEAFSTHARLGKVCQKFLGQNLPMLGFVAQDVRVMQAVRAQSPVIIHAPESQAAQNLLQLGASLINLQGLVGTQARSNAETAVFDGKKAENPLRERGIRRLVRGLLSLPLSSTPSTHGPKN